MSKKNCRGWQRVGTSVFYAQNEINVEHNKRFYYSLSFEHTFLTDNDDTYFAHCFPYTYSDLQLRLKDIEKNPKVSIRNIGQTCLKNNIPIVEFCQEESHSIKKAIIILARQHPGETVGSFIMDEILSLLSKSSS